MKGRFAKALVELRKAKPMTQQELADAVMVSRSNVVKWETGKKPPPRNTVGLIADVLHVSEDSLWHLAAWERIASDEMQVVKSAMRPDVLALENIRIEHQQQIMRMQQRQFEAIERALDTLTEINDEFIMQVPQQIWRKIEKLRLKKMIFYKDSY